MKTKRPSFNKTKHLSPSEYDTLHAHLLELLNHRSEHRNALFILTALYTGARLSEVLAIRQKDLDPDSKSVLIFGNKGSDDRDLPLPSWLFDHLAAWGVMTQSPSHAKPLFDFSRTRGDQIWRGIRTVDKKFHSLRHTFGMRTYNRCRDILLVKRCMGHREVKNTLIYVEATRSVEEIRKALY